MEKRFCDKCGKELPVDVKRNFKIGLWIYQHGDRDEEGFQSWKDIYHDICQDCAVAIEVGITGRDPSIVL